MLGEVFWPRKRKKGQKKKKGQSFFYYFWVDVRECWVVEGGMGRKPRIEYEGAVYHVMNRGDRGGKVFKDRLDFELFLRCTADACERTGWRIHAYALLRNHFHWLLETPEANLVDGMKWFLGAYSQRFNARHGQRGHVFQGRYKAVVIDGRSGDYFETVSTYIHLNPARARLLRDAAAADLMMH